MLAERGARVVDADVIARAAVAPGTDILAAIVDRFGNHFLLPNGELDRRSLGALVFADSTARQALEEIVHPAVRAQMAEQVEAVLSDSPVLVVADIPLLFEGGRQSEFPDVMLVTATSGTQIARLQARNGLSEREARDRLASQMPMDRKRELATWVIDNDGTIAATAAQVEDWWQTEIAAPEGRQRP